MTFWPLRLLISGLLKLMTQNDNFPGVDPLYFHSNHKYYKKFSLTICWWRSSASFAKSEIEDLIPICARPLVGMVNLTD